MCLKGKTDTGYRYVKEAIARGARIILADSPINTGVPVILCSDPREKMAEFAKIIYGMPDEKMRIIGVTGTNGKTTTTHLIKDIFVNAKQNICLIGTNGCFYNKHMTDKTFTTSTTPESCDLFEILKNMYDLGSKNAVMEVSSHALSQNRVLGMDFDIAVFTNLTQDHLDYHKNIEEYFKAKEKLFTMAKKCIINTDDEYGKILYDKFRDKSISYGLKNADIVASELEFKNDGVEFLINDRGKLKKFHIAIMGKFSVYNALCAYVVSKECGIDDKIIFNSLNKTEGVKGRAEKLLLNTDFSVIIDYAHTPDGMENIINAMKNNQKGRIITLFGCGGNRDKEKRAIMGEISGRLSDFTIITSDNPRFENPGDIINDIEDGIKGVTKNYIKITDRKEAIEYSIDIAKKDDIVLLLGKGHEDYIIFGKEKIYFDEREIVKNYLNNRKES